MQTPKEKKTPISIKLSILCNVALIIMFIFLLMNENTINAKELFISIFVIGILILNIYVFIKFSHMTFGLVPKVLYSINMIAFLGK